MKPRRGQPAIDARNLTKSFGPYTAVNDVSFKIWPGQSVAVLGANAAGKTTLIRLLTAFTAPTSGVACIDGFDVHEQRLAALGELGYVPENGPLYPNMTPLEMLRYFGESRHLDRGVLTKRLAYVIDAYALEPFLDKRIGKLSRGQRLSVALAQAVLHNPRVVIMDEPMTGLDAGQLRQLRRQLASLRGKKTLLISATTLNDIEAIVDRVIVLHGGRVTFDGTPLQMKEHQSLVRFPARA